jgi:hypothetical protein
MNSTLKVIGVSLAAFAVYLPIAYFSGRDYLPTPRPEGAVVETLLKIDKGQGFSYLAQSFSLAKYADDSEDNMKSPVILYEDSTRLGPGRSYLRDIQSIGLGRFAHVRLEHRPDSWRFVVFSTSDNSDPRTNGRKYWLVLE